MPCGSVCVRCALLRCHSKYLAALHLPSPFNSSFPFRVCHAERRSSSCKRLLICACSKAKVENQLEDRGRSSERRRERGKREIERGSWRQAETLCNFCLFFVFSSSASHDDAPRTLLTKSGSLNSRVWLALGGKFICREDLPPSLFCFYSCGVCQCQCTIFDYSLK